MFIPCIEQRVELDKQKIMRSSFVPQFCSKYGKEGVVIVGWWKAISLVSESLKRLCQFLSNCVTGFGC